MRIAPGVVARWRSNESCHREPMMRNTEPVAAINGYHTCGSSDTLASAHWPFMYAASAADQCGSARYLVIVLYVGMFV